MTPTLRTLCVTAVLFSGVFSNAYTQTTYIPDNNFEQVLIDKGYDDVLDDYIVTANINTLTTLDVGNKNIADLTGIEDFVALTELECRSNQLTSLDVSQNIALKMDLFKIVRNFL